jgi:nickel transport protein
MRTFFTISVLLVAANPALAHRLHVDARVSGETVRVEAFYDDDTPAQEAKVTLKVGDQLVAEGQTDDKGVWIGHRPKPGTYTVRAESIGHAAKDTLVVPEPEQTPAAPEPPPPVEDRAKKIRTPWGRLAAGLGIIGGLWLAWMIARRAIGKASGAP